MTRSLAARTVLFGFGAASAARLKTALSAYDIDVPASFAQVREFVSERGPAAARAEMARLDPGVAVVRCAEVGAEARCQAEELKSLCGAQIVFVSNCTCARRQAEAAGAFGAVAAPQDPGSKTYNDFCMQLMLLIRNARLARLAASMGFHGSWSLFPPAEKKAAPRRGGVSLIAIGASAGGTEALTRVVSEFTPDLPCVVIVQHMAKDFVPLFVESLGRKCAAEVREARDGEPALAGRVYVAPGGLQTTVERADGGFVLRVREGEKVSGHRPSVDALFRSVAASVGAGAVGVILTGMGEDGADGLLAMRKAGAWTIGQDAASCVVYGMPRAAWEKGAVSVQLPLDRIADGIKNSLGTRGADR